MERANVDVPVEMASNARKIYSEYCERVRSGELDIRDLGLACSYVLFDIGLQLQGNDVERIVDGTELTIMSAMIDGKLKETLYIKFGE